MSAPSLEAVVWTTGPVAHVSDRESQFDIFVKGCLYTDLAAVALLYARDGVKTLTTLRGSFVILNSTAWRNVS